MAVAGKATGNWGCEGGNSGPGVWWTIKRTQLQRTMLGVRVSSVLASTVQSIRIQPKAPSMSPSSYPAGRQPKSNPRSLWPLGNLRIQPGLNYDIIDNRCDSATKYDRDRIGNVCAAFFNPDKSWSKKCQDLFSALGIRSQRHGGKTLSVSYRGSILIQSLQNHFPIVDVHVYGKFSRARVSRVPHNCSSLVFRWKMPNYKISSRKLENSFSAV